MLYFIAKLLCAVTFIALGNIKKVSLVQLLVTHLSSWTLSTFEEHINNYKHYLIIAQAKLKYKNDPHPLIATTTIVISSHNYGVLHTPCLPASNSVYNFADFQNPEQICPLRMFQCHAFCVLVMIDYMLARQQLWSSLL